MLSKFILFRQLLKLPDIGLTKSMKCTRMAKSSSMD